MKEIAKGQRGMVRFREDKMQLHTEGGEKCSAQEKQLGRARQKLSSGRDQVVHDSGWSEGCSAWAACLAGSKLQPRCCGSCRGFRQAFLPCFAATQRRSRSGRGLEAARLFHLLTLPEQQEAMGPPWRQ